MTNSVKKEVEKLIEELNLDCSVKEFKDKVSWNKISRYQKLSENFIKEFKNRIYWYTMSYSQQLSENFIKKFKNKISWSNISHYQKLSEKFIKEFQFKLNWYYISRYQKLSEKFIREFKLEVDWYNISKYQKLSEKFIKEFKNKVDVKIYREVNKKIPYTEKLKEVKQYCEEYNLEFDHKNKCFYAFRDHDKQGRGQFNKTIFYKKGNYYKDWHLDMRKSEENSFGLGIFPKGNTKIKVLIKDWGIRANREDDKCRVWGFEVC